MYRKLPERKKTCKGTKAGVRKGIIMFFYNYYWLALIPLVIAMIASANVKSTYSKYEKIKNGRGLTGAMAARQILDANGLYNIRIEYVAGQLSDHFDPRSNVVRLSDSTYNSTSVAAVGVAAHEVGHAIQYAKGYAPMKLRSAIIPLTNIGSSLSYPLVFIGLIMGNSYMSDFFVNAGIILFLTVVVFQFATMSRKVLTAAALTYVAALFTAIMNLIRLLMIASNRNRRN